MKNMDNITGKYIPTGKTIEYVPEDNQYMHAAKEYARLHSLDKVMPTGAVIVKKGVTIGFGANGSEYHELYGCERVRQHIPTGQGYELCEGCSPQNHAEPKAIKDALIKDNDPTEADLYLWGHYWCCEDCWKAMITAGINQVYLMATSEILFNKENPHNIVGKQFSRD